MVGTDKQTNLFIDGPASPSDLEHGPLPPSRIPVKGGKARKKPLTIETSNSHFLAAPFAPQSPSSKFSRRVTLASDEFPGQYPLQPQLSPHSPKSKIPSRRRTLSSDPSTSPRYPDRNFSVYTLPDDEIHNATPQRSSRSSSRHGSGSALGSPSRIPVPSRHGSTGSTVPDDIYIPETPTRKGSGVPPPLSLEHFSYLVKGWKEKVEQELPPAWPLSNHLEKQPEHDVPSPWPMKIEHPHFQPKEPIFEVDTSSDDDVHSTPTSEEYNPAEVAAKLAHDHEGIPFAESVVEEPYAVCTKEDVKPIYDPDEELKKISRQLLRVQKYALTISLISINTALIFMSWYVLHHFRVDFRWWIKLHWIWLPMLTVNTIIQVTMIFSICIHFLFRKAVPHKIRPDPETLETMAWVLPCYNETPLELTRSLDSLAAQIELDDHKKVIIVICDGKARGKGMDKSCGESLLEDILPCDEGRTYKKAYVARDALDVTPSDTIY